MSSELNDKRIAILATDGVEEVELTEPRAAVEEAGARVELIAPEAGEIQSMNGDTEKSATYPVDRGITDADPSEFDAMILPGGVANPDHLRQDERVISFVREMFEDGKPVGVICHGPWTLVEADLVKNRTITSYPSLRTDILNAGGNWVDEQVVTDQGLVSSRKPGDLPAFCDKIIEEFAEGRHEVAGPGPVS